MNTLTRGLIACGVLAAGAVLVLLAQGITESVEVEKDVGLHGVAAENPWLALERLLRELHVPTESRATLLELPPQDTTLLLLAPRRALGPDRTRRLVTWVEDGGTLVVAPTDRPRHGLEGRENRDFLLEALDLEIRGGVVSPTTETVRFSDPRREFTVEYSERTIVANGGQEVVWRCEDTGSRSLSGPVAMQVRQGRGSVIVLADKSPLENLALGKHEHAGFAWEVLTHAGAPARAWIVRADEPPGLWSGLFRSQVPVLCGLAALIALWLWRHAIRVGPIRDLSDAGRRSLEEHLLAAGRFTWGAGRSAELLTPMRQHARVRLARRHPELAHASEERRVGSLASWTGLTPEQVRAALESDPGLSGATFVTHVRHLQRILDHT